MELRNKEELGKIREEIITDFPQLAGESEYHKLRLQSYSELLYDLRHRKPTPKSPVLCHLCGKTTPENERKDTGDDIICPKCLNKQPTRENIKSWELDIKKKFLEEKLEDAENWGGLGL